MRWADSVDETARLILCDAQTSGGLLISVPEPRTERLLAELASRGATGAVIGEVVTGAGVDVA